MKKLEIPAESLTRLALCTQDDRHPRDESCVRSIAKPVIAAELRRLADQLGGTDYGRVAAQVLHQRADELHRR